MRVRSGKLVPLLAAATLLSCGDRPPRRDAGVENVDSVSTDTTPNGGAPQPPTDTAEAAAPPPHSDTAWTAGVVEREGLLGRGLATPLLTAVRTARHAGFERLVFEFDASLPGYRIEYIDRPVRQCGSGEVVPLPGDAWLSIRLFPAHAHSERGAPTVAERDRVFSGRNLKRIKLICDFEAVVEWVAAVGSPNRFHVLELGGPTRLVVDIRE